MSGRFGSVFIEPINEDVPVILEFGLVVGRSFDFLVSLSMIDFSLGSMSL